MRQLLIISLFVVTSYHGFGQTVMNEFKAFGDSLYKELRVATADTTKIKIWTQLANFHKFTRPDSGIYYATRALALSRSIAYFEEETTTLIHLSLSYTTLGDHAKALRISREELSLAERMNDAEAMSFAYLGLGSNYYNLGNLKASAEFYSKAYSLFRENKDFNFMAISGAHLSRSLFELNQVDSALKIVYSAKELAERIKISWVKTQIYSSLGQMHRSLGNSDSSLLYFRRSYDLSMASGTGKASWALQIAKLYKEREQMDSSLFYANVSLQITVENKLYNDAVNASLFLAGYYEKDNPGVALQHSNRAFAYADSLSSMSKMSSFEDFEDYDEQQRQSELESAEQEYQSRIRTNTLLGITFTVAVIAFFLYRNNRQKQKAKQKIEQAYDQLKSTQSQLIQSEKMASLGELTAGIAHEIQNPLNFVNNFAEVSNELIDEMNEELKKGDIEEAKAISSDIKQNLEKISHHGKRADAIVKGMLQHSSSGSGKKEPTNINALADEYLRLAYHGLRAKDKSFNATMKTEFDDTIGNINIIPQDIGRVILNLITNAFYVVNEKSKQNIPGYEPTVAVSTKKEGGKVLISVKDNGNGIPQKILDKIFQPFFTTKPTGQGTGLGLSLSYDIVKAHGGELKVESEESQGTTFIIVLPIA